MELEKLTELTGKRQHDWEYAVRVLEAETKAYEKVQQQAVTVEKAQSLVQQVAEGLQKRVHDNIARTVTRCLRAVFGEQSYEFRIVFEAKRGKTEARAVLVRDGRELDPLTETGGGVVDVVAMALRLTALVLGKPSRRRLLVLDEPFRFVSEEYLPLVAELLKSIAEEMQVQLIMVSHVQGLTDVGKVIRLGEG